MKNLKDMQIVVLMGGLGTRLKDYTKERPKSLVLVNGRPFFDYQLKLLMAWGFEKFLFLIGYHAEMIEEYYGDGTDKGISIRYCYDGDKLLGTGGAIRNAYSYLEDDFILIYGDSFMDIDYAQTVYRYERGKERGCRALMTVLKNNNCFDKSNVVMDGNRLVLYDKHNTTPDMDYIDYGVCAYEKSLFADYEEGAAFDIAELQNRLSVEGKLTPQIVTKRFYEIGSPKSLKEFSEYAKKRFETCIPAVFLDRDGVINEIVFNEDTELMDSPLSIEEYDFLPKAAEAIKIISEKGYYVFVVTNQPAAAKGKTTLERLYDINTYMIEALKSEGAYIDDLFMCPHYTKKLKTTREDFLIKQCDCRKPKPGMIYKALRKYKIDLKRSYMAGDSCSDVEAGGAAGLNTVFLGTYKCDACKKLSDLEPDYIAADLMELAEFLPEVN